MGLFVGKAERSNEYLLLTSEGLGRSNAVRRCADGERFEAALVEEVRGYPWNPHELALPANKGTGADRYVRAEDACKLYVTKKMVTEKGPTKGCPRCEKVANNKPQTGAHTDACQKRFLELYPERLLTQEEERPGVGGTAEAEELLEGRAKRDGEELIRDELERVRRRHLEAQKGKKRARARLG